MKIIYNVGDKRNGEIIARFIADADNPISLKNADKQATEYANTNKNFWVYLEQDNFFEEHKKEIEKNLSTETKQYINDLFYQYGIVLVNTLQDFIVDYVKNGIYHKLGGDAPKSAFSYYNKYIEELKLRGNKQ